jgi:hypothetical protein
MDRFALCGSRRKLLSFGSFALWPGLDPVIGERRMAILAPSEFGLLVVSATIGTLAIGSRGFFNPTVECPRALPRLLIEPSGQTIHLPDSKVDRCFCQSEVQIEMSKG